MKDFVSIDFETWNCSNGHYVVCSVGMVKVVNNQIVDTFHSLVKPLGYETVEINPMACKKHHIKRFDVKNAPGSITILSMIEAFVGEYPLLAHNATTEKGCIKSLCCEAKRNSFLETSSYIDTLSISERCNEFVGLPAKNGKGWNTLEAICERFGISVLNVHNALDDAMMAANLYLHYERMGYLSQIEEMRKSAHSSVKCNDKPKFDRKAVEATVDKSQISENPFLNKTIVVTGVPEMIKVEYKNRLTHLGAKCVTSVNASTDILIYGDTAGQKKLEKAKLFGTQLMSVCDCSSLLENFEI